LRILLIKKPSNFFGHIARKAVRPVKYTRIKLRGVKTSLTRAIAVGFYSA